MEATAEAPGSRPNSRCAGGNGSTGASLSVNFETKQWSGTGLAMGTATPMTVTGPTLSSEEQEQLQQTIEMFEVIVQASPQDCQSLEILKDAYNRLGRQADAMATTRKLADTYRDMGQFSQAFLEYEWLLQKDP